MSLSPVLSVIHSADAERLRTALLEKQLLVPLDGNKGSSSTKRSRNKKCMNCKKEFDVTANKEGECTYHSGKLKPHYDDDFWADHDEDCHGVTDSRKMREDLPEGFKWDCCDEDGTAKGCRAGAHEVRPVATKRSRT